LVLDVTGDKTEAGSAVGVWHTKGQSNQQWQLSAISGPQVTINNFFPNGTLGLYFKRLNSGFAIGNIVDYFTITLVTRT